MNIVNAVLNICCSGLKTVLGSLTFGGYDSARFAPNDVTFPLDLDDSRELVVGIQAINSVDTAGKSYDLLSTTPGIMAYIDSTLAELWLPATSCAAFEDAFGLAYDPVNKLYPVNSSLHTQLQTLNHMRHSIWKQVGPNIQTTPYISHSKGPKIHRSMC